MNERPPLFDSRAVRNIRARAHAIGFADFLQARVADEIKERLTEVNRGFTDRALIAAFPDCWTDQVRPDVVNAPGETIDFNGKKFDLIVHAMDLHTANDPVGQLIQMRHALRPDGMALVALLGGQTLFELRAALTEAEAMISGGLRPRISPMAEIRDLGGLLQRAGFALPVADSMEITATYKSLSALMRDLRAMGETNALSARSRTFTRRELFHRAEEIYRDRFGLPDGRIPARFEVIFLTGWAPDESQQKPLKPGSGRVWLGDALGDTKLDD